MWFLLDFGLTRNLDYHIRITRDPPVQPNSTWCVLTVIPCTFTHNIKNVLFFRNMLPWTAFSLGGEMKRTRLRQKLSQSQNQTQLDVFWLSFLGRSPKMHKSENKLPWTVFRCEESSRGHGKVGFHCQKHLTGIWSESSELPASALNRIHGTNYNAAKRSMHTSTGF